MFSGLLQYFPSALAAIARHSYLGNEKHNPGTALHWDRAKSGDEADACVRHLMEGDYQGAAWRALALLQKHLESKGEPIAPAARNARQYGEVIPHTLAEQIKRDILQQRAESDDDAPHHAVEAPMPPAFLNLPSQDAE